MNSRAQALRSLTVWRELLLSVAASVPLLVTAAMLPACSEHASRAREGEDDAALPPTLRIANDASADSELGMEGGAAVPSSPVDASEDDTAMPAAVEKDSGDTARPVSASLVSADAWRQVGPADDPFDDRPSLADCPTWAATAETLSGERAFGVDTGICNYVTVTQLTSQEVAAGESVKVRLWHFELNAPEPAEAHVAVVIDGLHVLDERVTIPQPGGLINRQLQVARTIAAGARVYFHLHNHGANSWALVDVSRTRSAQGLTTR